MTTVAWPGNAIKLKVNPRDHNPPHCHVEGKGGQARVNLNTFAVMSVSGYSKTDMDIIMEGVKFYAEDLKAKWEEYHGKKTK